MKIYESLAEASLYRTVALIPEQIMFGLALSTKPDLRSSPETFRNLEHGREFCEVFWHLSTEGADYRPPTASAATIAAGIQALPSEELPRWTEPLGTVKHLIEDILAEHYAEIEQIDEANRILQSFASFAKQQLSGIRESEQLRRA